MVVDAATGLVAVDRDTVPVMMGDVTVTFAGSLKVPGEVLWTHPEHNLTLIRYDPDRIGNTPVVRAKLDSKPLSGSDPGWLVGLTSSNLVVSRKTVVERIRPFYTGLPGTPSFRDVNIDLISLQDVVSSIGGVLVDRSGAIRATWASFIDQSDDNSAYLRGLPIEHLIEALDNHRTGLPWHGLGAELARLSLVDARNRGLPGAEVALLEGHDDTRQVLEIIRITTGTPAASHLQEGDLILRAGGQTITTPREMELAMRGESAALDIFRDGEVVSLTLPTAVLPTQTTRRLIGFAGAMLQTAPIWLAHQRAQPAEGVYVNWYWYGSPAAQFGLKATRRIVAMDGTPVADLDTLLALVEDKDDRDTIELTTQRLDGRIEVITLRLDLHYWPTFEIHHTEDGWQRRAL